MKRSPLVLMTFALVSTTYAQVPPPPRSGDAAPQPRLFIADRTRDLGSVNEGDVVPLSWQIENRGTAPLVLQKVEVSCGCTLLEAGVHGTVVEPNGAYELKVKFDSTARRGENTKTISILTNDPVEPKLSLEFIANVSPLFDVMPPGALDLRSIRRGETVTRSVTFTPAVGRKELQIVNIAPPPDDRFKIQAEPHEGGQRLNVSVGEHLSLGPVRESATVSLTVDGVERTYEFQIRGEIVGDLTWRPTVLDVSRQPSLPGKRFAPVTIEAIDKSPFRILRVDGGPWIDAALDEAATSTPKSKISIIPVLKASAPPGPFGGYLQIFTDNLDQPVIRIPVFGIVSAPLEVDPPLIVLRQDGTEAGTRRRVKLQAAQTSTPIVISAISCDNDAVTVMADTGPRRRASHIEYLVVTLSRPIASGAKAVVTVRTNVPGADTVTLPVVIEPESENQRR